MSTTALLTLDDYLSQFLQSGVPIQVATRNEANMPAYSRSWGCQVCDDRQSVVLFLYRNYCQQALQNIRDNGVYAAVFVNALSYETYQLKGTQASLLEDLTPYQPVLSRYQQAQEALMKALGLPVEAATNMAGDSLQDYVPVLCPVGACFRQTPGPGAGAPVTV